MPAARWEESLLPTQAHDSFAHGALGRVFGSLLPTQAHASFEHACIGESALIGLLLPLLSPPCCLHCAPMLSSFSCPPHQKCANAGSLVCVPALAHWCVCPVCTRVLTDPCCLPVKGHQFSHSQHLVHQFSHGYPLVKAHQFPWPATRRRILPNSPMASPSRQSTPILTRPATH